MHITLHIWWRGIHPLTPRAHRIIVADESGIVKRTKGYPSLCIHRKVSCADMVSDQTY